MAKAVDIVFRISSELQWDYFCFNIAGCSPMLVWKEETSKLAWNTTTLVNLVLMDSLSCYSRAIPKEEIHPENNIIYALLPADKCFPWNTSYDNGKWSGAFIRTSFQIIKKSISY